MTTLGLSLKLSSEAIASLQSRQSDSSVADNHSYDEGTSSNNEKLAVSSRYQEEDWEDTIAVPADYLNEMDAADAESDMDDCHDDEDDDASSDADLILSLGLPLSLPLVVVNLQCLCGFIPSSAKEAEELRQQIIMALSHDDDHDVSRVDDQQEHDSLSRHFDARVEELFDNGVANHGDTLSNNKNCGDYSLVTIDYPEFLCRSDRPEVMTTSRQWKRLCYGHRIRVVNRLFQHLANCNRPLSWKVDMHEELMQLVKKEKEFRRSHQQECALVTWRTERRKQQLDKLYQVRETFDHRLDVARERLNELEGAREDATRRELRQLRLSCGKSGGLEALDFDTNIFSFGEYNFVADSNTVVDDERELNDGDVSSGDSGYDQEQQVDINEFGLNGCNTDDAGVAESSDAALPIVCDKARSRARRKAAQQARQRRLQLQQEVASEQSKIEQAHMEEERVREAWTTPELRMAQATVRSFEERMQQVDDLLESLQEEEWADEEQGITQTVAESAGGMDGNVDLSSSSASFAESNKFSLLDSVLAMILGSLPQNNEIMPEDHYKVIRKEHQEIADEWREYFGRLPVSFADTADDVVAPPAACSDAAEALFDQMEHMKISSPPEAMKVDPTASAAQLRQSLGIMDNTDNDDWDDVDHWDTLVLPAEKRMMSDDASGRNGTPAAKQTTAKLVLGLRPGGKVSR